MPVKSRGAAHAAQGGFVAVAVMIMVALIFFAGTAIALSVSSSLRAIDEVNSSRAIDYAVDSAVATGVASSLQSAAAGQRQPGCPASGQIEEGTKLVAFALQCHFATSIAASQSADLLQVGMPAQQLPPRGCLTIPLPSQNGSRVWTSIGFRSPAAVSLVVWVDNRSANQRCQPADDADDSLCSGWQTIQVGVPAYLSLVCPAGSGQNGTLYLHVQNNGSQGAANLGAFVVRTSQDGGSDCVATVLGSAGVRVLEADVLLPGCRRQGASATLWNAVFR